MVAVEPEEEELDLVLLELFVSMARPVLAKGPASATVGTASRAMRERERAVPRLGCMSISLRRRDAWEFPRNSLAHRKIRGTRPRINDAARKCLGCVA